MARQVGQIAFGLAGLALGGPVGFAVGNMLGAALFGAPPQPASLQKLRLPQTQVGTMFPIIYGGALPGETLSQSNRAGVRTAGVFIDCDKKGGITQKGGKTSGGTTGAPNANSAPKYLLTCAMAVCDARTGPVIIDQIFFNDKCKWDRFEPDQEWGELEPEYDAQGNIIAEIGEKIELYRGTWKQQPSSVLQALHSPEPVPAYRGLCYIVFNKVKIKSVPTITVVCRNSITGAKFIVTNHMKLANVPEFAIDLCHLNYHVRGAFQNNDGGGRDLCEQVAKWCFCDLTEFDGRIKDVSLVAPAAPPLIPQKWMRARVLEGNASTNAADLLKRTDEPLFTKPSRMGVRFSDIERNWNDNEATAARQLATHHNPTSVEVGVVAKMDDVLPRARIWLDYEWSKSPVSLDVAHALIKHAPGGVVEVHAPTEDDEDATQLIRLGRQSLGETIKWEAATYDPSVFENVPAANAGPGGGSGGGDETTPAYAVPVDFVCEPPSYWPDDTDSLNLFGQSRLIVAAGSGPSIEWAGAEIVWNPKGVPGSESHLRKWGLSDNTEIVYPATMGTTQSALASTRHDFDYNTVLRVSLLDGELASATENDVLSKGANRALLKDTGSEFPNGGRWIQFTTAIPVAPLIYDLTGLLAGRFGTEYITSTPSGAQFLLITDEGGEETGGWVRVRVPRLFVNRQISYVVAHGEDDDLQSALKTITPNANSLRAYAPMLGDCARDSSGNLTIRWTPRTLEGDDSVLWWGNGGNIAETHPQLFQVKLLSGATVVHSQIVNGANEVAFSKANLDSWYGVADARASGTVQQLPLLLSPAGFPLRFSNL